MSIFNRRPLQAPRFAARIIFAAVLGLAAAAGTPAAGQNPPDLILLFTGDVHSAVSPHRIFDEAGRAEGRGGFARIAAMIKAERERHGDRMLVVDVGDMIAGSLFQVIFQPEAAEMRLMKMAGIEVTTFGNHEFDYGSAALARALTTAKVNGAAVPLVASNVAFDPKDGQDDLLEAVFKDYPVDEYLVVDRNGLKIGLMGLMGRNAADDAPAAAPVVFTNMIARARETASILREREKVDLVIALSHAGTTPDPKTSEDEKLAAEVPDIDVIVSGHTHRRLVSPILVGSTIIVGVGCRGEDLGDLRLERTAEGRFRVVSYALRPVTGDIPEDPEVAAEAAKLSARVDLEVEKAYGLDPWEPLAETEIALAMIPPAPINSSWEIGLGDLVTDAYRRSLKTAGGRGADGPVLAIHPWGNMRDSLFPGPITGHDVFNVLSLGLGPDGRIGYPLVCIWLTGREIRRAFEVETTIAPGHGDAHLQISGAFVRYNPRRIPFDRVTAIEFEEANGTRRPMEPDRLYPVVANLYLTRMLGYVSRASHGILKIEPKDADGNVRTDFENLIIDGDPASSGVQEVKEWISLAAMLRSFSDADGDGLAEIPPVYAASAGRLVSEPSWNPVKLLAGAHAPTYVVLGLAAVVLLLAWIVVHIIRRRFARRKARAAAKS